LNVSQIKNLCIILPKKQEDQIEIENFLNKKTFDIDVLIADKKKFVILLEEIRQTTIQKVVTRGLNSNVKMKNSQVNWIGEIPENWGVSKIKYQANINIKASGENTMALKYLLYLMRSEKYIDEMVKRSNGVSNPEITSVEIGNMECLLPDKIEQVEIVNYIDKQLVELNNLVKNTELQIQKLEEYRKSLILEVVTGEIDVRNYFKEIPTS
jgi:restriction endonuclease S subunit